MIACSLREDDELISVQVSSGTDDFLVASRNGKCIRFSEEDVRPMGRTAAGVRAIQLDPGDEVVSLERIFPGSQVLAISELGMGKRTPESEYRRQSRGGKGVAAMLITDKTGPLCALHVVSGDEDVMLIRDDGTIIRMPVTEIREIGRHTQGVRLMQVDSGLRVVSACMTDHEDPEEEGAETAEQAPSSDNSGTY